MSVRCEYCGEGAGYGYEIGHRSDCPELRGQRPATRNEFQVAAQARAAALQEAAAIARERFVIAEAQKDERAKGCNDAAHWIYGRILQLTK